MNHWCGASVKLVHRSCTYSYSIYELYTFNSRQLFLLYCLTITVLLYCGQYLNLPQQRENKIRYYHIFFDPAHKKNPSNIIEGLIWGKIAFCKHNMVVKFFTFYLGRTVQTLLRIFLLEILLPSVVFANHYLSFCCCLHCLFPLI
jgi:hypothetical protein